MTVTPARSYTRIAIAIIIAAVVVSASTLSYSLFEATVTRTTVSFSTTTVMITSTVNCADSAGSNTTNAFSVDCLLGITLDLAINPAVSYGEVETVNLSLTNDLNIPNNVSYTGFPTLPGGLQLSSPAGFDDVLPVDNYCGYPSAAAFIAVYNGSGTPVQLNDDQPGVVNLPCAPPKYQSFNASQTISDTLTFVRNWTSPNPNQPWVNATDTLFSPGNYTMVAFDPWGQLAELNFTVLPSALYFSIS